MGFLMLASSIPFLLGLVMLTMGMTLGARDFLPLLKRPWDVCLGVAAQFLVMPLVAWAEYKPGPVTFHQQLHRKLLLARHHLIGI